MTIFGISQSSGVERKLKVEMGASGLVLTFIDHRGGKEQGRILVPMEDLLASVTEPPADGSTIEGMAPPSGPKLQMKVEVHRNEVLLTVSTDSTPVTDIAIGLDDLQDAMEKVMN